MRGLLFVSTARNKNPQLKQKTVFDYTNIDETGISKYPNEIDCETLVFSRPVAQQAEAYSNILLTAREQFLPTKQITIRPCDQPWVNSYTRLLLRKKNRNYHLFKKDSCKLTNAISKDRPTDLVT